MIGSALLQHRCCLGFRVKGPLLRSRDSAGPGIDISSTLSHGDHTLHSSTARNTVFSHLVAQCRWELYTLPQLDCSLRNDDDQPRDLLRPVRWYCVLHLLLPAQISLLDCFGDEILVQSDRVFFADWSPDGRACDNQLRSKTGDFHSQLEHVCRYWDNDTDNWLTTYVSKRIRRARTSCNDALSSTFLLTTWVIVSRHVRQIPFTP